MRKITHLSLFSGIGGLDLAAEWAGIQTVGQCEWADYPTKVLEKHWPDVPRWRNIRTLTKESFYERTGRRTVDIISGGFPCQPFSVAGKQRGKEDDRYLWPEMVRVIQELRPTWVVGENVAGIVRMALPDILSELESIGYRTRTFLIPACAVGARHVRYRVAIVGYAEHNGLSSATITGGVEKTGRGQQEGEKTPGELEGTGRPRNSKIMANTEGQTEGRLSSGKKTEKPGFGSSSQNVADTNGKRELQQAGYQQNIGNGIGFCCEDIQYSDNAGWPEQHFSKEPDKQGFSGGRRNERGWSDRSEGERAVESALGGVASRIPGRLDRDFLINHYWDIEPDIPRISSGAEYRVDRLKCLGNAVVPQQFYPVFRAIAEIERGGIN